MKRRTLAVSIALSAVTTLGVWPAQAASTYTIAGPRPVFTSSGLNWSTFGGCNPAWVGTPANGIDSRVVDIGSRAGQNVTTTWTGTDVLGSIGSGLNAYFFTHGCQQIATATQSLGSPGTLTLRVPTGAKWVMFDNGSFVDVKITF